MAELIGFHKLPRPHNIDDIDQFYSWQNHSDVLIIGGGVVGSSIAFFLEESFPGAMNITVLEKDPTVSSTVNCNNKRPNLKNMCSNSMQEQQQHCHVEVYGSNFHFQKIF